VRQSYSKPKVGRFLDTVYIQSEYLYSALSSIQSAQTWITQFYPQITTCRPFLRKRSPDGATPNVERVWYVIKPKNRHSYLSWPYKGEQKRLNRIYWGDCLMGGCSPSSLPASWCLWRCGLFKVPHSRLRRQLVSLSAVAVKCSASYRIVSWTNGRLGSTLAVQSELISAFEAGAVEDIIGHECDSEEGSVRLNVVERARSAQPRHLAVGQ